MTLSCYSVYEFPVGIAPATSDPETRSRIQTIQVMPIISWNLSSSRPKQSHSAASSVRRWRQCLPRSQTPASRPATPCKSVETSRPRRWWHRSQDDEAGSTAKRAWRPAASGAGGTARRRMRLVAPLTERGDRPLLALVAPLLCLRGAGASHSHSFKS